MLIFIVIDVPSARFMGNHHGIEMPLGGGIHRISSNWVQFARGRLGGLHRSLSSIIGQPKSTLIWEGEGWFEDEEGDYSSGTLAIDGPAVRSLRIALGI